MAYHTKVEVLVGARARLGFQDWWIPWLISWSNVTSLTLARAWLPWALKVVDELLWNIFLNLLPSCTDFCADDQVHQPFMGLEGHSL